MPVELTVRVKSEEKKTVTETHLIYESFQFNQDDDTVKECIDKTLKGFVGTPDKIKISAKFEVV